MDFFNYVIIVAVLFIIAMAIVRMNKKDYKFEINKLINYLGGKDNITSVEDNKSRLIVTVNDVTLVNKEGIQKLGARGIVEIENQLKIIYGTKTKEFKRYIDEMKQL